MSTLPSTFKLERYFAKYEMVIPNHLSSSDVDPLTMAEVLAMASKESRALWDGLSLAYTDMQGMPQLRREISTLYDNVTVEDVMVACPQEGIFVTMHCLADYYKR